MSLPIHRNDALSAGAQFYITGRACRAGHVSKRYATTGQCCECVAEQARQRKAIRSKQRDRAGLLRSASKIQHQVWAQQRYSQFVDIFEAILDSAHADTFTAQLALMGATELTYDMVHNQIVRDFTTEYGIRMRSGDLVTRQGDSVHVQLYGFWYNLDKVLEVLNDDTRTRKVDRTREVYAPPLDQERIEQLITLNRA